MPQHKFGSQALGFRGNCENLFIREQIKPFGSGGRISGRAFVDYDLRDENSVLVATRPPSTG